MSDEVRHRDNGADVAGLSVVEERSLLGRKPILEWSREDWQLWAAGLADPPQADDGSDGPEHGPPDSAPSVGVATEVVDATPEVVIDATPEVVIGATLEAAAEASPVVVDVTPEVVESTPPAPPVPPKPRPVAAVAVEAPVEGRGRARSAVGLVVLALVVGATVAGLVSFLILVSGLILRRALG